ncbi:unnamed protein product [Mesocestoides corti]|uniref:Secreted protein n=1 Tax=Mesocestoides corti TaxID=53468 RepID=A0A0R3U9U4_MESCO|nr:unnamed protein product [Mesocestoides corti]
MLSIVLYDQAAAAAVWLVWPLPIKFFSQFVRLSVVALHSHCLATNYFLEIVVKCILHVPPPDTQEDLL